MTEKEKASVMDFLLQITPLHAEEFKDSNTVKDIRILLEDNFLAGASLKFNKKTGEITGEDLNSKAPISIRVSSSKKVSTTSTEVTVSLSDLAMMMKQKRMARKIALGGILTDLQTKVRSLISIDPALIGEPGVDSALDILASEALLNSSEDPHTRYRVNTGDPVLKDKVTNRLVRLEHEMNLKEGSLTSLFDLKGFDYETEAFIMAPDSEPVRDKRNLILSKEDLISFKLDLATTLSRVAKDDVTNDQLISVIKSEMDPATPFDTPTYLKVIWGRASSSVRKLWALLPEIKAIGLNLRFRLAEHQLRSTGSAA